MAVLETVSLSLAKDVGVPLLVNIASQVLGDKAPVWLAQYRNHDIPAALAKAWKIALNEVRDSYIKEKDGAISETAKDDIRALVGGLSSKSVIAKLFPTDMPNDPLSLLNTNPIEVIARRKEAVQATLDNVIKAVAAARPTCNYPQTFFEFAHERLGAMLFYYFVEIAIKENEKANKQITFEQAIDTFRRLWRIEEAVASVKSDTTWIVEFLKKHGTGSTPSAKPLLHNLPERIRRFVDRPVELDKVHAILTSPVPKGAALHAAYKGHGGQGKSTLALAYAWRCRDESHSWFNTYPGGVYWLHCDVESIVGPIAALASACGASIGQNDAETAKNVKTHLENGPISLLVLDNVRDAAQWASQEFASVLPAGHCRHLITTRARGLPDVDEVSVGYLS